MTHYLLDTNVWLRAIQSESSHHRQAVDALASIVGQGDEIFVTAQNLIEFWSVASRISEANGLGWTVEAVHVEISRVLAQFPLLDDTPAVFVHWLDLVTRHRVVGRRVHDARLVAVMLAHSISHLLTFNVDDFRQFSEVVVVEPGHIVMPPDA
jgi:predicted nucleic acid-binding protein